MTEPMHTEHVAHLLPAFVAGTLEATEQRSVLAHLTDCVACRAERAAWEVIRGAVRDTPEAVPAEDVILQQVWNRVDADTARGLLRGHSHTVVPSQAPSTARARALPPRQRAPRWEAAAANDPPRLSQAIPHAQQAAAPEWRWPMASVAAAALVAFTLAVAILALGLPRAGKPDNQVVQAPVVLATPATPASDQRVEETLLEVTLPPEWVPETIYGGQNHYTMAPGSTGTWDPTQVSATCCQGFRLNYVLEGTYTMRGEGVVRVLRQGSQDWDEIAPGTEVVLSPGDALLSQMADRFVAANTGADPVELLDGVLFAGEAASDPIPQERSGAPAWTYHDQDVTLEPQPVPSGPVVLRLRKVPLDKGSVLPRPAGAVVQLGVSLDSEVVVLTNSPSSKTPYALSNVGIRPVTLYVLTLEAATVGETGRTRTPAP